MKDKLLNLNPLTHDRSIYLDKILDSKKIEDP